MVPTLNPNCAIWPKANPTIATERGVGKTRKILEDANGRDKEATARDAVADERGRVADLKACTDPSGTYPGQVGVGLRHTTEPTRKPGVVPLR